jgi:hypothetical protein
MKMNYRDGRKSFPSVEFENCTSFEGTDKAVQVQIPEFGDKGLIWIPKNQIHDDSEIWMGHQKGILIISEWIAKEKGLI